MIFSQPDFSVQPVNLPIQAECLLAFFQQNRVLLTQQLSLPTYRQMQPYLPENFCAFDLAHTGSLSVYSPHPFLPCDFSAPEGFAYHEISIFRSLPFETAALITTSWHLWNWYQSHRFCGSCSAEMKPSPNERSLVCSQCGKPVFPVISPAVIVAITCGERILLARNTNSPFANYALVAGYVEVGETLEHAVRREVLEEVGVEVHNIRYLGDQPWGVSSSHMFAFHAQADDQQPICIQKNELSDARWFNRRELPVRGHAVSIAHALIERFRKGEL